MPKYSTFPTLYNEVLTLNISKLRQWGYLDPAQIKSGNVLWSRNKNNIGQISIKADTYSQKPYIELDYKYKNEPRKYKIYLTVVPSNLNKGEIWYFICPITNKRCRLLYCIDGYFLHREAFKGCFYETQTRSKQYREYKKTFDTVFDVEELYNELDKKYFKKTYSGKPTKRYLKILKRIDEIDKIPKSKFQKLFSL